MIVQKAFKYRFFTTHEQAAQLARTFGCARYVYNQALEYRTKAWQQEKKSAGYHLTAAKLTEWKKEPEKAFLSEVSSVVLQQSLRNKAGQYLLKWLKTTGWGARKVTPTRNERRRSA